MFSHWLRLPSVMLIWKGNPQAATPFTVVFTVNGGEKAERDWMAAIW